MLCFCAIIHPFQDKMWLVSTVSGWAVTLWPKKQNNDKLSFFSIFHFYGHSVMIVLWLWVLSWNVQIFFPKMLDKIDLKWHFIFGWCFQICSACGISNKFSKIYPKLSRVLGFQKRLLDLCQCNVSETIYCWPKSFKFL